MTTATTTLHATGASHVRIPVDDVRLDGDLVVPHDAFGSVIFANGSGSGRHSRRNQYIAGALQNAGLATLRMDLLTPAEERVDRYTAQLRYDIDLLARRLVAASRFVVNDPRTLNLPIGLFGAGTGCGAALVAAAHVPHQVAAVVSHGGRPDLACDALPLVKAATLLIVGGDDDAMIGLNYEAHAQLRCKRRIEIISGATHLFEEPDALEHLAALARNWFETHLPGRTGAMYADHGVIDGFDH
jgi:dienelactone hydrolase